jgi:hypothetical protein
MNINVYLPDDLGRRAKEAELPLSRLLQAAVADELERRHAMAGTLSETQTYEVDVENDDGKIYTGRITGTRIAEDYRNDTQVFATDDDRVIVYDGEKRRHYVIDDPAQDLRGWLAEDTYVAAMSSLGLKPIIDL